MFDSKALTEKLKKVADQNQATKDVEAFGMKLKLRLLSSDEDMMVYDGLNGIEGINYLMTLKKDVLARSIFMIDGQEIPDEVDGPDGTKLQRRIYLKETLLKDIPQMTLDQLHAAYLVMNIEFKNRIDGLIKFDNADLINKFLEEESANQAAAKAVDGLIEQELAENAQQEQAEAKPAPAQPAQTPKGPPTPAETAKMTSFARRPAPGPKA